ncbi:flagellar basal body-associated FliL family protein [Hellea sp.]|nr:flagellar basal body-associated FliL family protein [Hellea sp.]
MARKKDKTKKAAAKALDFETGDEAPKKKGGVVGSFVTLVALGAASFGTVFMLPGNNQAPMASYNEESSHHGHEAKLDLTEDTSYLELTPLTISLQDDARILKIGITLETLEGEEDYIDPNDPKIRDAFVGYLRALRLEQIEDAAFMAQMRAQLLRRAQLILGAENVRGILITDFLVR